MEKKKLFIVEDEPIIALEISELLKLFGYEVMDISHNGEIAIQKILQLRPDLVLLDISLKGKIDGVTVAKEIEKHYDVPVIYITAYSDEETISRVKLTQPYGFLIKPFNRRELETTIELAFYKFEVERKLKESEAWLNTTLKCIGDAIIATDKQGLIKFANTVALDILELKTINLIGEKIDKIFHVYKIKSSIPLEDPVSRLIREGNGSGISHEYALMNHKGKQIIIEENTTLIKNTYNAIIGVVLVFRDITERKIQEDNNEYRNECDKIISEISNSFLNVKVDVFNKAVNLALEKIGKFMDVDYCYIYNFTIDNSIKHNYSWALSPIIKNNIMDEVLIHNMNWSHNKFLSGESLLINCRDEIPAEGSFEKELGAKLGIKSMISVPLFIDNQLFGLIGVCSIKQTKSWRIEDSDF